jgi:hypothetical protein
MRRSTTAPVEKHPAPVPTKFLRLSHAVDAPDGIEGDNSRETAESMVRSSSAVTSGTCSTCWPRTLEGHGQ